MIIDGHAHACGDFLTAESIVRHLDKHGVDKVVLVPGELDSAKTYPLPPLARLCPSRNVVKLTNALTRFVIRITGSVRDISVGNERVYDIAKQTQGRVIQFLWITQQVDNPRQHLSEKLLEWGFKGIKLHQCWESYSIKSDFFRNVAGWAEENDIPLFIHMSTDKDVKNIIRYKRDHRRLRLLVAHLFGLELFIKAGYKDDNLYFDTSTVQVVSIKRFIDAINFVGAARITFGTDTPYGKDNLPKNIERIGGLDIPDNEKEMILGVNMKQLLSI